jgi:K+-transporting ATPase c subunit
VNERIEGRVIGIFGEQRVNVLELNLVLDRAASR